MFPAPETKLTPYIICLNLNITLYVYGINSTIKVMQTFTDLIKLEQASLC